jgi:hypothetical protein
MTKQLHGRFCRIAILIGLLLWAGCLFVAGVAHAQTQTGAVIPRAYLPLTLNDVNLSWQWLPASSATLTPTVGYNGGPVMAVDHAGQAHLFWGTTDTRYPAFIYHRYLAPAGWTDATPVAHSLGTSSSPLQPLVAPDGTLHLMWLNRLTNSDPLRILYASFRAGAWTPEEEVYRASASYINYLWAAPQVDGSGQLRATLTETYMFITPMQATRTAQGWTTPTVIPSDAWLAQVWADHTDGVHLYTQVLSAPATYGYWRNGAFVTQNRPTGVNMRSRQTQMDAGHNLHIYWTGSVPVPGGQVTGLYHQCIDSNLNLSAPTVLSGTSNVSDVAAAADETGRTVLTWRENNAGRVRAIIWRGCAPSDSAAFPPAIATNWHPLTLSFTATPNMICGLTKQISGTINYTVQCVRLTQ